MFLLRISYTSTVFIPCPPPSCSSNSSHVSSPPFQTRDLLFFSHYWCIPICVYVHTYDPLLSPGSLKSPSLLAALHLKWGLARSLPSTLTWYTFQSPLEKSNAQPGLNLICSHFTLTSVPEETVQRVSAIHPRVTQLLGSKKKTGVPSF